jgi:SOS response regulatory protein OraA/RecX
VNEIYNHALRLLAKHDYTVSDLRGKLAQRFGIVPDEVIDQLIRKRFLNDRRYAENYIAGRTRRGKRRLRQELEARGIEPAILDEILSVIQRPSLQDALKATMTDWNLRAPLSSRDAARLFRALARLEYEEDAIREELEQLHD